MNGGGSCCLLVMVRVATVVTVVWVGKLSADTPIVFVTPNLNIPLTVD